MKIPALFVALTVFGSAAAYAGFGDKDDKKAPSGVKPEVRKLAPKKAKKRPKSPEELRAEALVKTQLITPMSQEMRGSPFSRRAPSWSYREAYTVKEAVTFKADKKDPKLLHGTMSFKGKKSGHVIKVKLDVNLTTRRVTVGAPGDKKLQHPYFFMHRLTKDTRPSPKKPLPKK